MSILFDAIKTVQNKPIDKVSETLKNERLSKCESCPFMNKKTRSCGTLFMGGTIVHNGAVKELCGCRIDDKITYKDDACPLNNW